MQLDNSPREDKVDRPSDASETCPQQGGEGGTTRFGMEEGDNTDVPATVPATREDDA